MLDFEVVEALPEAVATAVTCVTVPAASAGMFQVVSQMFPVVFDATSGGWPSIRNSTFCTGFEVLAATALIRNFVGTPLTAFTSRPQSHENDGAFGSMVGFTRMLIVTVVALPA